MVSNRRRLRSAVISALALTLTMGLVPVTSAQVTPTPTIRLRRASGEVTLYRYRKSVPLNLSVFVEALHDDFVLKVARDDFGLPFEISQVDPETGELLREIPAELLDGLRGLKDFTTVTFRKPGGKIAARTSMRFCPNSYERQRMGDAGPTNTRFPDFCGSRFPFFRGTIWGIDHQWATGAFDRWGRGSSIVVEDGTYTVRVRIAPAYVELFEIAPEDAVATMTVTVKDGNSHGEVETLSTGADSSAAEVPAEGVPTMTDPDPELLPDIAALPAFSIGLHTNQKGRERLVFAANEWNEGPQPLVIEGFRRTDEDIMDAFQYFYDSDGNAVGKAPVGTLEYHAGRGHNHWHFLQFVSYTLHSVADEELVRSKKQSFCIVPTDAIDLSVRGASLRTESQELHSACGGRDSMWVREALPVGWGDTYYQYAGGQAFNVTDLENGWYQIRIHVNPNGDLFDRSTTNDAQTRLIRLRGEPGARRVIVAPWNGIEN